MLLTKFVEPCEVVSWYEMAVVEDFGPLSERKTKADASNSAVMFVRINEYLAKYAFLAAATFRQIQLKKYLFYNGVFFSSK